MSVWYTNLVIIYGIILHFFYLVKWEILFFILFFFLKLLLSQTGRADCGRESYFYVWQVFRHCGAEFLLTRLKRNQKRSSHRLDFLRSHLAEVAMGYTAKAIVARQEVVSFFSATHKWYFIIIAMLENLSLFEDRQADSGALCVGAVLVLTHPILCAT